MINHVTLQFIGTDVKSELNESSFSCKKRLLQDVIHCVEYIKLVIYM